jgi:hypothetical protein
MRSMPAWPTPRPAWPKPRPNCTDRCRAFLDCAFIACWRTRPPERVADWASNSPQSSHFAANRQPLSIYARRSVPLRWPAAGKLQQAASDSSEVSRRKLHQLFITILIIHQGLNHADTTRQDSRAGRTPHIRSSNSARLRLEALDNGISYSSVYSPEFHNSPGRTAGTRAAWSPSVVENGVPGSDGIPWGWRYVS